MSLPNLIVYALTPDFSLIVTEGCSVVVSLFGARLAICLVICLLASA